MTNEEEKEFTKMVGESLKHIWVDIVNQREEILRAFICKYGYQPDEVEQVIDISEINKIKWSVRKKGGSQDS